MTDLPKHVDIHEEGPREGFQIEPGPISTADKIRLIEALAETGLHHIQAASLIPQMADRPAGAPLPRPVQPQSAEPDMHHIAIQNWRRAVLGEQRDLPRVLAS